MPSLLIQNRYEILQEFLVCRFSTLYRATDRSTGAGVLIRMVNKPLPSESYEKKAYARAQMLREGRLLARLSHRNLPSVLDVIEEKDNIYLLLNEMKGKTLEAHLAGNSGPIDEKTLKRWLIQFISVLDYLHSQSPPVIYRDIRPDAILVIAHGIIKLAEFGMARMTRFDSSESNSFASLGSPLYAAPEQLLQAHPDPRNDIYSLGALFYFLATRKNPPKSLDRLNRPAISIKKQNPAVSKEMENLIMRMMEPEKEKRIESMPVLRDLFKETFPMDASASISFPTVILPSEQGPAEKASASAPPQKGGLLGDLKNLHWFGKEKIEKTDGPSKPSEEEMAKYPFVDLHSLQVERDTGRILPESISRSIQGVVIGRRSSSELTIAVKDPTQIHIYDHVTYSTKGQYKAVLVRADPSMIDLAIEFIYRTVASESSWLEWLQLKKFEDVRLDVKQKSDELEIFGAGGELKGPAVEAIDRIIKEAISIGASDIHMETFEQELVVRYRIDGVLHPVETFSQGEASTLTKRVKIIAGMDIAQDRVTQGGRISVKVKDRDFDLRISIVPVTHGENIVMRLLNKGSFDYTLSDLGFQPEEERKFRTLLEQPYGMILVSGPTGSGKSTTLYASLKEINRPDRKLLTVEDPIEYEMPGITQVQVNMAPREDEKKVTFARALREFLRQDPDVILVGEIRDTETAAIAVQAALTGHLLLSTIHTNNSVGIITRLEDMQVEPFLIASTLLGGIAQRLVRKVCSECSEEVPVLPAVREMFARAGIQEPHLFHGKGCLKCRRTGYSGRVAGYEILEVTPEIRSLISSRATVEEIQKIATGQGMRLLYLDGLRKAAQGLITIEEVERVTMAI